MESPEKTEGDTPEQPPTHQPLSKLQEVIELCKQLTLEELHFLRVSGLHYVQKLKAMPLKDRKG